MQTGQRGPTPTRRAAVRPAVPALATWLLGWLVLGAVPPAGAHALLVSSDPRAGSDRASVPAVVTLAFDEPLVPSLSSATVTAPSGARFAARVVGEQMRARLAPGGGRGVYQVDWKTVSEVDGHVITGSFEFGVGTPGASPGHATVGPAAGDVTIAVLRGLEYALLLLSCGICSLGFLAAGLPLRQPVRAVAGGLLAAGVAVVTAELWHAASGLSPAATADYLAGDRPGWARVARLALEAGLLVVALRRRRLSAVLLTGIVAAVALAGHGAVVEPVWQGVTVNAAHLAAAGVWAGGIMALGVLRLQRQWLTCGAALLRRFSRVAPWAFAASVLLGAVQATQLLGSPRELLASDYGLTLVAKAVVIGAMVSLSLLAWRRLRPHLRAEAVLALVVTAAAAALAAFPVVPKEAREAAAEQAPAPRSVATFRPRAGDLTLGGRAGAVMVGLTVHPGRPGRNTLTAYLAPPATRSTSAQVRLRDRGRAMHRCGPACRTTTVTLRGGEPLALHVDGHGTATFRLPALPAPPAGDILRSATQWMARLRSYRDDQVLSGIRSQYRYAVPHRLFTRTWFGAGPQDSLWLGRRLYRRDTGSTRWRLQVTGTPAPVPYFPWMPFEPLVSARVVGRGHVSGVAVRVVSAFDGHGRDPDPVWFTLYVDGAGRILRSRMWATGHFMDDHYTRFNEAVRLPSPGG